MKKLFDTIKLLQSLDLFNVFLTLNREERIIFASIVKEECAKENYSHESSGQFTNSQIHKYVNTQKEKIRNTILEQLTYKE